MTGTPWPESGTAVLFIALPDAAAALTKLRAGG
jgi:hypothetical protein